MLLEAPVPDPGPPGPYGTMAWLRATVSRFANGETHARRRALVEALLADLDPAELREAAARATRAAAAATAPRASATAPIDAGPRAATAARDGATPPIDACPRAATAARDGATSPPSAPITAGARRESKVDRALHDEPCSRRADAAADRPARLAGAAAPPTAVVDAPYIPVAVLAEALGVDRRHVSDAVAATRVVAAAYHPHTDAPGADAALATLLELLPSGKPEAVAARVQILVQACEATAGLVRGDDLPVPVTRRIGTHGEIVLVDLTGRPFGAGSRRCPGEAHARALVEGVLDR